MRLAKWGNSLAIRVPASVVEALALKPGDEVEVKIEGERSFALSREPDRRFRFRPGRGE